MHKMHRYTRLTTGFIQLGFELTGILVTLRVCSMNNHDERDKLYEQHKEAHLGQANLLNELGVGEYSDLAHIDQ